MDIRSAQQRAWENKVAKGFNTTDIPLEFCLLQGDIAEAFATWAGITGHDDQLPDLSPDGFAGRTELDRSTLAALETAATAAPRPACRPRRSRGNAPTGPTQPTP